MNQDERAPVTPGGSTPQRSQSLYSGAAGIALQHIENALTGTGGWDTVHRWASATILHPVIAAPDACGLYEGAPAVAFALQAAHRPAYTAALGTLDGHIASLTRHRLKAAHERIDRGRLPALREFDLISGLTGVGVYLLCRNGSDGLLHEVLSYLVRLTDPLKPDGEILPGWWSSDGPDGRPSPNWPGGHGNFGLAHGIAGPLALLATAMRRGFDVPGHADAIDRICAHLDHWQSGTGSQTWWPEMISRAEWHNHVVRQVGPGRPSWCYGTPGLARAQQLAALATADTHRQQRAEDALAGCIADERQLAQLSDASLCHGWAGLLQTTWRVAADAGSDTTLAARLPHVRTRLHEHLRLHGPPDHDGLMTGRAGVHLTSLSAAVNVAPTSCWDACLLLAG